MEYFFFECFLAIGNVEFYRFDNFLKEYVRYLPFGLSIAGSFLYELHSPIPPYDKGCDTPDEITRDAFERGGKTVDTELRALIVDMFQLNEKHGLTLPEI